MVDWTGRNLPTWVKMIGSLIVLVLLVILTSSCDVMGYEVQGDTVMENRSEAVLTATPHTLSFDGTVTLTIRSKTYSGDMDVVFGFDSEQATPTGLEYKKTTQSTETSTQAYTFHDVTSYSQSSDPCKIGGGSSTYEVHHANDTDFLERML